MVKLKAKLSRKSKKSSGDSAERLSWFNLMLAGLFALQAVAIWFLSEADNAISPVTANFLTADKLASDALGSQVLVQGSTQLFDIKIVYLVVAFLLIAALGHLLSSTLLKKRYKKEIGQSTNSLRWVQFTLSMGLAVVTVGLLAGIQDIASLIALFGLVALANTARMFAERAASVGEKWKPGFWLSLKAGAIMLLIFGVYVWAAEVYGSSLGSYLYFVIGTAIVAFTLISIIFKKTIQKSGKWSAYSYGDWSYMVVSLVGLSAIAWQIFAGALR